MKVRANIVVASHLSDAQIEMSFNPEQATTRLNFVKYLILLLDGDMNCEINPDKMFKKFRRVFNK